MKKEDVKIGYKPSPYLEIIGEIYKKDKYYFVKCKCKCGNEKDIKTNILENTIKSCGCLCKASLERNQNKRKGTLVENGLKKCARCLKKKKIKEYTFSSYTKDKYCPICNECNRYRRFKGAYNITKEIYDKMLLIQNNKSPICNRTSKEVEQNSKTDKHLSVDHCHRTGKIRGLLCSCCNTAIGRLGDHSSLVYKAFLYLKQAEESNLPLIDYDKTWQSYHNNIQKRLNNQTFKLVK